MSISYSHRNNVFAVTKQAMATGHALLINLRLNRLKAIHLFLKVFIMQIDH